MNQQFRKLALETDAYCDQHYLNHPYYNTLWEQKFAELIVRECLEEIKAMIVDESELLYPNNKQTTECVNDRLMDAHDNIVEHFGVEE